MSFRSLVFALLALLTVATSGRAIEIEKARYGGEDKYLDVKDTIRAYVRHNKLSFRVTKDSMGGDRNPGKTDRLYIEYTVDGHRYKDTVREGDIFTFKGVSNVTPSRSYLGIIPPFAPSAAPLRITNQMRGTVLIYALDRYGRWMWQTELPSGRTHSATGAVGQQWKVTDRTNQELESFTIRPGDNRIVLDSPSGPARVRFDNAYPYTLYIYRLNRWGGWEWVSYLGAGRVFSADAVVGENWFVIDVHGRLVRQVRAVPGTTITVCGP